MKVGGMENKEDIYYITGIHPGELLCEGNNHPIQVNVNLKREKESGDKKKVASIERKHFLDGKLNDRSH